MRNYISLFVHGIILRNTVAFISFIAIFGSAITLWGASHSVGIIRENPFGFIAWTYYLLITANAVFIAHMVISLPTLKKNFQNTKFSNGTVGVFKYVKPFQKRIFYNVISNSIIKNDFDAKEIICLYDQPSVPQKILIEELTSEGFKREILTELNWPRFYHEISSVRKRSLWIRDILNYKAPYNRALIIVLNSVEDSVILNSIGSIKLAIVENLLLSEKGIGLNSAQLRKSISEINRGNNIDLAYRIVLNPKISQKQFASVLEVFTKKCQTRVNPKEFTAGFTGYLEFDQEKYNLSIPMFSKPIQLSREDAHEFIALLAYLKDIGVIENKGSVNSETKLGKITRAFWENADSDENTLRRHFSKKYKYRTKLSKHLRYEVNSTLYKHQFILD